MKKQFLLFTALLMGLLSASAQKPDTAGIIVHYKFSHLPDTTNPKNIHQENITCGSMKIMVNILLNSKLPCNDNLYCH